MEPQVEMEAALTSLTAEEARRALLEFYKRVPAIAWEGTQPNWATIEACSRELRHQYASLSSADRELVSTVLDNPDEQLQADIASFLLTEFATRDFLRPYVKEAVDWARQPTMMLDVSGFNDLLVVLMQAQPYVQEASEALALLTAGYKGVRYLVKAVRKFKESRIGTKQRKKRSTASERRRRP